MPSPFACDMTAISAERRGAHHQLTRRLMTEAVAEIRELPNGLAFRFAADEYDAVNALDVAPDRGPLILRLTGEDGVKDFIRAELGVGDGFSAP